MASQAGQSTSENVERQVILHEANGDIRTRLNGAGPVEGVWFKPGEGTIDGDGEMYISIDSLYGLLCEYNLLGRFGG